MEENRIPNTERPEEDIGELIKVRREKLRELQEAGKDPFREVRFEKTAMSRAIRENYPSYDGKTVSLAGRLVSKLWERPVSRIFSTAKGRYSFTLNATFWATRLMRNSKNTISAI